MSTQLFSALSNNRALRALFGCCCELVWNHQRTRVCACIGCAHNRVQILLLHITSAHYQTEIQCCTYAMWNHYHIPSNGLLHKAVANVCAAARNALWMATRSRADANGLNVVYVQGVGPLQIYSWRFYMWVFFLLSTKMPSEVHKCPLARNACTYHICTEKWWGQWYRKRAYDKWRF